MDDREAAAVNRIPALITCRELKHALMRALNTRVAELYDNRHPTALHMHPLTLEDLMIDQVEPADQGILNFIDQKFMGVPYVEDPRIPHGAVHVLWPDRKRTEVSRGSEPATDG